MDVLRIKATGRPKNQTNVRHTYRKRRKNTEAIQQPVNEPNDFLVIFPPPDNEEQLLANNANQMQTQLEEDDEISSIGDIGGINLPFSQTNDDGIHHRPIPYWEEQCLNEGHLDAGGRQQVMRRQEAMHSLMGVPNTNNH